MRGWWVAGLLAWLVVGCGSDDAPSGDSEGAGSSGGVLDGVLGDDGAGSSGAVSKPSWTGETQDGYATYYDATGAGACSFDASPGDLDVVALADPLYLEAAQCGACAEVTGPSGTVTVRVVDRCPDCKPNGLDLSRQAFAKIAEPALGHVDVQFRYVACAESGPMRYRYKDGSSRWWTGIQVLDHTLPIAKLELKKDGAWVDVKRESYNYFVLQDGAGPQPDGVALRITAADGQVVEDSLPPIGDDPLDTAIHPGTAQFD